MTVEAAALAEKSQRRQLPFVDEQIRLLITRKVLASDQGQVLAASLRPLAAEMRGTYVNTSRQPWAFAWFDVRPLTITPKEERTNPRPATSKYPEVDQLRDNLAATTQALITKYGIKPDVLYPLMRATFQHYYQGLQATDREKTDFVGPDHSINVYRIAEGDGEAAGV